MGEFYWLLSALPHSLVNILHMISDILAFTQYPVLQLTM